MKYILITFILTIIGIICIYNAILERKNKVDKVFSSIDVILKKRYDLVPSIVESVKGYAKYEKEMFESIISIRTRAEDISNKEEAIDLNIEYNNFVKTVFAIVENYPKLKANESFLHLQAVLNDIEEQLSAARRTYNANVENYNTYISIIPINILAVIFGFKKYSFFEIQEKERENKLWI